MDAKARKREATDVRDGKEAGRERAGATKPVNVREAPGTSGDSDTARMLSAPRSPATNVATSQVGKLVGFKDNGRIPLVTFAGQPGAAAIPARATVDLQATHIGSEVVLTFTDGDWLKPIVLGVIRALDPNHLAEQPGHVEVEADGERMMVSAKDQLVLRCGKAMITLTRSGKILIEGTYVSSRSSGVYRIKGGSVQLN